MRSFVVDKLKEVEGFFACRAGGSATFGSHLVGSNPTGEDYGDKILPTVVLFMVLQRITPRRSGGRDRLEFVPPSCRYK